MTNIYITGYGESEAVPANGRRSTSFRSTVEAAVNNALVMADAEAHEFQRSQTGIVFVTSTGERWPEVWRELKSDGKSVTPIRFPSIVHNAAPGQIAIRHSFTGPHLAIVEGDALALATIQIRIGRTATMVICGLESPHIALSLVVQGQRAEGQRSCMLGDVGYYAPSASTGFRLFAHQYAILVTHFERYGT